MATKVVMAWSGGKDAAMALWRLRQDPQVEVVGLLTTFTERYDRVQLHGVRRILVEAQAEALELPLHRVWLPPEASNAVYERVMGRAIAHLQRDGVQAMAFGDLFLQDIRAYRERMLAPTGLAALFPLWGSDTAALAQEFVRARFHATVVCVNPALLSARLLGRPYDAAFLEELPERVDRCGENGEFHTFAHGGPPFAFPLATMLGTRHEWQGHVFADLLPVARRGLLHA